MTTLQGYEGMEALFQRLESVRWRHRVVQIAHAASGVAAIVLASLIVLGLAMGFWPAQPPAALREILRVVAAGVWLGSLVWFVWMPIRRRLNLHQTARLIEDRVGGLHNELINALLLARDTIQPSPELVQHAIRESVRRTGKADLSSAVSFRGLKRWATSAAAAAVVLAVLLILFGQRMTRGWAAVVHPGSYVRQVGSVKLVSLQPGDATVFAGSPLTIVAKIDNPQREHFPARVEIAGRAAPLTAFASLDRSTYTAPLGKAEQSFDYAVWIGDSKFPADRATYHVEVFQRVEVEGLDLATSFPAYMNRPSEKVVNAPGPFEVPLGSGVEVTVRLRRPAPRAVLETRSGQKVAMRADATGARFTESLRVNGDDAYRVVLTDASGRKLQQVPDVSGDAVSPEALDGYFGIRAIPDQPPTIQFIKPNADASVPPGGSLETLLRAREDYGIKEMRFYLGLEGEPARPVDAPAFRDVTGTAAEIAHTIEIGPEYRTGDVLVYYASATDGRQLGALGGPQTVTSPHYKIVVQDPAVVEAQRTERYDQLRARLMKLLAAQEAQRVNTAIAAQRAPDLVGVRTLGATIAHAQQAIKTDMLDVVDKFPFTPELVTIQQALALLGHNQAAVGITQARVVAGLGDMAGRGEACAALAETQDEIIQSLQTLLAILPSLANPEAAKKASSGEDLPPDAKEKLSALKAELDKFIDEQRKIINAGERLTKRPVDNFTREDDELLKQLEAAQDKWEKFLNEKFTDFSKLAQQDFSKPALLKELISVKTDVTMAKDALGKKAVEIATAIEDNGIENAKSLTANIEKWLPDEPDRIKWDMEDPAGQSNIEQPELPKELEDLVGDLLEQEEDLFEEMDDVTGKYAMSGDKGIGWDAMDGPISNMNAQGVTGNQLPNTSEISGRSGEGRQGKSGGEFVEDKAVGKGGRRTPTRLTPEPFQQGQVNDTSQEPAGGATGGGKLSGSGAEGMEGPLPPELQKELDRMAGKQAQIRNAAERVQAGMKVTDFSNYQFLQAITLMNRVQQDMDNYRYTNALRQKDVTLGALRRTQLLLAGKIDVTADVTANMPKYIKDDIADASQAKLPPEFEAALKKYFSRLAETGKE